MAESTAQLTDDEIVALVAETGVTWPLALATVDVTDDEAMRAAVVRGIRSLLVRDLARARQPVGLDTDEAVLALVRAVAGASTHLQVRLGVDDADATGARQLLSLHGTDGAATWISATSSPLGINEISVVSSEEARSVLHGLLAEVYTNGVPEGGGSAGRGRLQVLRSGGTTSRTVVVERGSVTTVGRGEDAGSAAQAPIEWSDDLAAGLLAG